MLTAARVVQRRLSRHRVYGLVTGRVGLRHFLPFHVHCVWAELVLLKSLRERARSGQANDGVGGERNHTLRFLVSSAQSDWPQLERVLTSQAMYRRALRALGFDDHELLRRPRTCCFSGQRTSTAEFTEYAFELASGGDDVEVAAAYLLAREILPANGVQSLRLTLASLEGGGGPMLSYLATHCETRIVRRANFEAGLLTGLMPDDESRCKGANAALNLLSRRAQIWEEAANELERLTPSAGGLVREAKKGSVSAVTARGGDS